MSKQNIFYLAILMAIATLGFSSCSDDDEEKAIPEIVLPDGAENIFENEIVFNSSEGERTFQFTTNVNWNISVSETRDGTEWCSVYPNSGQAGTNNIKIKVNKNLNYDDRNVILILRAENIEKHISVTQKQLNSLTLSSSRIEIGSEGGDFNIEVKSNIDFKVSIDNDCQQWITQTSKSRGLETSILKFNVAKSEDYAKREGTIFIESTEFKETFKIYQSGHAVLILSKENYSIPQEGGEIKVDVQSNFDFGIRMPDVTWIKESTNSKGSSSHTLYFAISPNDTYEERTAKIEFYDKNSDLSKFLVVKQTQSNTLKILGKNYEIMPNGGKLTIEIQSNIPYEMKLPNEYWIHKEVKSKALESSYETVIIDANNTESERTAEISFINEDFNINEIVTIKQKAQRIDDFRIKQERAGNLNKEIPESLKNKITKLTVEGKLNGDDIRFIREMAGCDVNGNPTNGALTILNMRYANIVEGGDAYHIAYHDGTIMPDMTQKDIFGSSFFEGSKLKEVIIPQSVNRINGKAFMDCKDLYKVELNEYITGIYWYAFGNCVSLKTLTLPESLTEIGDVVFTGSGLEEIKLPSQINKIGMNVFQDCTALTKIDIPFGMTTIPRGFVAGCTSLVNINIPNSVQEISDIAFSGCEKLRNINLSTSLIILGSQTFTNCKNLEKIELPQSLQQIKGTPFLQCPKLLTITCKSFYPPQVQLISDNSRNITVYVPQGAYWQYKNAQGWKYCNIVEMNQ